MLECDIHMHRKNWNLSFQCAVPSGSVFCLYGSSGAGKSSVLNVLAGFEKAARTRIVLSHEVVEDTSAVPKVRMPVWQRGFAYVEQTPRLFPHMTIRENILYGVLDGKWSSELDDLITAFQLQTYLSAKPRQLSGGFKQRVALVRALAMNPRVLLLDEPFSALDWRAREELQELIVRVYQKRPITTLFVTHSISEAQRLAQRIGIIDQGKLLQEGTVSEVLFAPASLRVAQLVGYTHFLQGDYFGLPQGAFLVIHPDQVLVGKYPERGLVTTGRVSQQRLREGQQRIELTLDNGDRVGVTMSIFEELAIGKLVTVTLPNRVVYNV